jgi:hypothetical protein
VRLLGAGDYSPSTIEVDVAPGDTTRADFVVGATAEPNR